MENSLTLKSLETIRDKFFDLPEILLYDNSLTSRYNNNFYDKITYYKHSPNNTGVAGAYNYALKLAENIDKSWVILFDQDTDVNPYYFSILFEAIARYPNERLFCPTILSGSRIISPTYFILHKPFLYRKQKKGLLKNRFYTALNSGLAIKLCELTKLGGFDSQLPLDYSDHFFISKFKEYNNNFVVIDCQNQHSLSGIFDQDFTTIYNRFQKFYRSTRIYANKVGSFFPWFWFLIRALKLTAKFRRFDFLKFIFFKK